MKIRATAAQIVFQVVEEGQSLSTVLPHGQQQIPAKDKALLQEICFGTLRWLNRLEFMLDQLVDRQLKGRHRPLHYLMLVGLYQLFYTRHFLPPFSCSVLEWFGLQVAWMDHRRKEETPCHIPFY